MELRLKFRRSIYDVVIVAFALLFLLCSTAQSSDIAAERTDNCVGNIS
jgi:hypothetical protein